MDSIIQTSITVASNSLEPEEVSKLDELSKAYKNAPSIEHYVKIRRENPNATIEVAVIGGMEQLFYMGKELRKFGIDPALVASAMDADEAAVSELSLQLMEKMLEARKLLQAGQTHLVRRGLAIPNKLIDWIITCSLDAMSWNDDLEMLRDLIVLIRERLGGSNPEYEQASWAHKQKGDAAMIGGQIKAKGVTATLKMIAGILGVAPSTVKRWFADGEFEREIEWWAGMFDQQGNLIQLGRVKDSPLHKKQSAQ